MVWGVLIWMGKARNFSFVRDFVARRGLVKIRIYVFEFFACLSVNVIVFLCTCVKFLSVIIRVIIYKFINATIYTAKGKEV